MRGTTYMLLIAIIATAALGQGFDKMKLLTPEIGGEYGIGDEGHMDLRLGLRFNIPGAENFILGFGFQTGMLYHETDNLFYVDGIGYIYDIVDDWTDMNYDLLLGWEFKPYERVNPYFMTGLGFVSYGFTATDSYTGLNVDVSSDGNAMKIPLILGCDFKVAKNVAISPYVKVTAYMDEMNIEIADYEGSVYTGSHLEDLNEWRGTFHLGVNLAFPIFVDRPKDTDGDGVWDDFDMCPGTPPGTIVNERGCPRRERKPMPEIDVERDFADKGVFITNEIFFEFNSDEITPDSYSLIDKIGKVLEKHPAWVIEVAGHTDSIGTESYNKKLSERRAKAVKNYLVANFTIVPENLSAQGYGESMPIADNGTSEGRAQNRRVEFKKIN